MEVALSHLVIFEDDLEALVKEALLSLSLLLEVEVLSGLLDSESAVTDVDALLSEGFLQLEVKVLSYLWLGSRILVDPQTHLVGEFLIVKPCRQKGLFDDIELDLSGPLVRL
jgi:hypothetical protein